MDSHGKPLTLLGNSCRFETQVPGARRFGGHFRNLPQKRTFEKKKVTGAGGVGGVLEGENVGRQALFPLGREMVPKQ